jgi:hypothetical protein
MMNFSEYLVFLPGNRMLCWHGSLACLYSAHMSCEETARPGPFTDRAYRDVGLSDLAGAFILPNKAMLHVPTRSVLAFAHRQSLSQLSSDGPNRENKQVD